jgi:hypothetical protein
MWKHLDKVSIVLRHSFIWSYHTQGIESRLQPHVHHCHHTYHTKPKSPTNPRVQASSRTYKIIKSFFSISFMGPFGDHFIMRIFTSPNSISITPKHGIKWTALFHYRVMKQQFHDSVTKYDSSIIPCFDIVVPHYLKVLFHSKYAVEKLILPPGRHNFDSSEPGTSWLENEIVVQALRLDRFKCNNISKYGTTQQHSKRKSGYSIVTVWHLVHDLYLNMYGTDQQPQHPHWHNQLAGGVVVRSDITQHIDFLSRDRQ